MKHVAFFGVGDKTFALTAPMIRELEQKTGLGFGALYQRCMSAQFYLGDLIETIRLGLIGAGTSPADAQRLVETYASDRPVMEFVPLALDIIEARYSGSAEPQVDPDAATTGDLAAVVSEAYADVPDV